jgi:hypothetical protein
MAVTDISANRTTWQGILIEDPRVVATITSGDEDGLHVGPATPTATGSLVLRTVRTERASSQSNLVLTTTRPGAANSQGVSAEVTATVGSGQAMGWADPVATTGFARLGSSAFGDVRICRRGGGYGAIVKSSDLSAWTSSEAHDICHVDTLGGLLYVGMYDDGARLVIRSALYPDNAVSSPQSTEQRTTIASTTITRIRIASTGGTAILLAQLGTSYDRLYQWASDDGGLSWKYVGSTSSTTGDDPHGLGDVCAGPEGYVVCYAVGDETGTITDLDTKMTISRIASPFLAAWTGSTAVINAGLRIWDDTPNDQVSYFQATICREETGRLWVYTVQMPTDGGTEDRTGYAWWSVDGGAVWTGTYDVDPNNWMKWDNAADRPSALDSVCTGGAIYLAFSANSSAYVLRLGGWSGRGTTITGASTGAHNRGPESLTHGWDYTIMGIGSLPSVLGWTASGTATATAANDHTSWTGAGAPRILRLYTLGVAPATASFAFTARASAAMTDHEAPVILDVVTASGGATYGIRLAIGSDTIRLYRRTLVGYTAVGSAVTHGYGDVWADWLVYVSWSGATPTIRVAGRTHGSATLALSATDVLSNWTDHISTTAPCTDVVFAEPAARISVGGYVATGETGRLAWLGYTNTSGTRVAGTPSQIPGRSLGPLFWAPPDVLVQAGSGIAKTGDLWTITDAADGSVAYLLDGDLTLPWRAPSTSAATITLTWGDAQAGAHTMGLLLRGIVAEGVTVRGNGSTNLNLTRSIFSLDGVKAGKVLTPDPTDAAGPIVWESELAGSYLRVAGGGSTSVSKVAQFRGGTWGGNTAAARAVLASTPTPADGAVTVEILPSDLFLIWDKYDDYTSITIELAAATSTWPSGTKWEIARALVGPVIMLGDRWEQTVNMQLATTVDDGKTADGRIRPRSLRPPHRVLSVKWDGGIPEDRLSETAPEVCGDGSNNPAAYVGTTARTIEGIVREIEGAQGEVVAILGVAHKSFGEDSSLTLVRREQFLHGRVISSVQRDTMIDDGAAGTQQAATFRVGDLVIEEST